MKKIITIIILICILAFISGCVINNNVRTDNSQLMVKNLKSLDFIKAVKCLYIRPSFTCNISVKETITEDRLDQILEHAITYVTEREIQNNLF